MYELRLVPLQLNYYIKCEKHDLKLSVMNLFALNKHFNDLEIQLSTKH